MQDETMSIRASVFGSLKTSLRYLATITVGEGAIIQE
jgi:hypothetical protein